jgi:hypothetical protein
MPEIRERLNLYLRLVTTISRHFPMPELTVLQADEEGALGPRT